MTTRIKYSMGLAAALALTALTACQSDDIAGTDNGNAEPLPVTIGQITIGGGSTSSTRTSATASPATRLATANPDAWETGDLIRVSAAGPDATTLTATYRYNAAAATADARWTQIDPARTDDPDAAHATGDTYPLYLESLGATGTDAPATTLETWGGSAGWSGSTDYLDQSTPDGYRLNDYLRCHAATRALAGTGKERTCQLSGTLSHQRVSLVLKVADGGTSSNRLPQDAVLRLYLTDGDATTTLGRRLTAWREGKTDASGTPGSSSYVPATTTFRALVALEDVPGIIIKDKTGAGSGSGSAVAGTVRPGSVLGEVIYTDRGTRQTQYITYSVKSAPADDKDADGNALIAAGTRITVTATFKDAPYVEPDPDPTPPPTPPTKPDVTITGTATLTPWQDTDLGEVGTTTPDIVPVKDGDKIIYQVYTAEGLQAFANIVNGNGVQQDLSANARLMADIDLSNVCGDGTNGTPNASWTPIGDRTGTYSTIEYTGTFDGQGHTVKGLYISSANYQYAGLFGFIGTGGKVECLRVEAKKVENTYNSSSNWTGVLVGSNDDGTIIACSATGNVKSTQTDDSNISFTGGLVGRNSENIIACYATGNVTSNSNGYSDTGGLVGNNSGNITACYATGNVTGSSSSSRSSVYVGGLVGNNFYESITACYATGNVGGSYNGESTEVSGLFTGCLVGNNDSNTSIIDCFWQKGADDTSTAGIGGGITSGSGIILTEVTGIGPDTWDNIVGEYKASVTGSTSTLNAAIHTWNTTFQQGTDKYCGYKFVKNDAYKSAADTPNEAPLLLTPIKEKQ